MVSLTDRVDPPRQIGVNSRADLKCQGSAAPAPIADSYDWIRDTMIALGAPDLVPPRPDYAGDCVQRMTGIKSEDGKPYLEISISKLFFKVDQILHLRCKTTLGCCIDDQ